MRDSLGLVNIPTTQIKLHNDHYLHSENPSFLFKTFKTLGEDPS